MRTIRPFVFNAMIKPVKSSSIDVLLTPDDIWTFAKIKPNVFVFSFRLKLTMSFLLFETFDGQYFRRKRRDNVKLRISFLLNLSVSTSSIDESLINWPNASRAWLVCLRRLYGVLLDSFEEFATCAKSENERWKKHLFFTSFQNENRWKYFETTLLRHLCSALQSFHDKEECRSSKLSSSWRNSLRRKRTSVLKTIETYCTNAEDENDK